MSTFSSDATVSASNVLASLLTTLARSERDGTTFDQATDGGGAFSSIYLSGEDGPLVSIDTDDADGLADRLGNLGFEVAGFFQGAAGGVVDVYTTLGRLTELARVEGVESVEAQVIPRTSAGSVQNQWRAIADVDFLQQVVPGSDGTGIDYGILSDTIDQVGGGIAASQATGDLPPSSRITILDDNIGGSTPSDEGRAMAELMFDIAPGADILYHTAFRGQANFASGITDLAAAGADVIVDDITYLSQAAFQDDIVAQAVDNVVTNLDIPYFSSAGNANNRTYFAQFNEGPVDDNFHDFSLGGNDQGLTFTLQPGATITSGLQWSNPLGGATRDFTLRVFESNSGNVLVTDGANDIGSDPYERVSYTNNTGSAQTVALDVFYSIGAGEPDELLFINTFTSGTVAFVDNDFGGPSIYGHHNSQFGFGVGAVAATQTNVIESFSSLGGIPTRFDVNGNPINITRQQPAFVAADGISNTFFGNGNVFFGTSAAAPNAAAVAVLMQEAAGGPRSLPFNQVNSILRATAVDIGPLGFEPTYGSGRIDALPAVVAANNLGRAERFIELNNFGGATSSTDVTSNTDIESFEWGVDRGDATTRFEVDPDFDVGVILLNGDPDIDGNTTVLFHQDITGGSTGGFVSRTGPANTRVATIVYPRVSVSGLSAANNDLNVRISQSPTPALTPLSSNGAGAYVRDDTLSTDYDPDWFAFTTPGTLAPSGNVSFSLTRNAGLDAVVSVYEPNGTLVARIDDGVTGGSEEATLQLDPGSPYRVLVRSFRGQSNGDYRLVIQPEIDLPDDLVTFAADTAAVTSLIPFGPTGTSPNAQGVQTFFDSDSDVFGYFFGAIPELGNTITVDTDGTSFDTVLGVYAFDDSFGALGRLVGFNDDIDGANNRQSRVTFTAEPGTRYMALVSPFSNFVNDEPVINVDYGSGPANITPITLDVDGDGSASPAPIAPGGDASFFSFVAPSGSIGTGSVTFRDGNFDGDLYVFDANGNLLGGDSNGNANDEAVNLTGLVAGDTYHITAIPEDFDSQLFTGGNIEVNLDIILPPPPAPTTDPDLVPGDDSGESDSDNITNNPDGVLSIASFASGPTEGRFVRLYRDGVLVAGPTEVPVGFDSFVLDDTGPLPDGTYVYTTTAANSETGPESNFSDSTTITIDTQGPQQDAFQFNFDDGPGNQNFFVDFNEGTFDYLVDDIVVTNTTLGQVFPTSDFALNQTPGNAIADLFYDPTAAGDFLPDGNYELTIDADRLTDVAGNGNDPFFAEFFFLNGDANRDRTVDLADFGILRANFGTSSPTRFSEGDFNYDGTVDLADFGILRAAFGTTLVDPNAVGASSLFDDE
ncbi:MAG: hypothetical protein AAF561_04620 [Planctomycetota bacterium]